MRRLFLAIDFEAQFRGAIGAYAMSLRPHFRAMNPSWVEPNLYHLTLHFFGELDKEKSNAIIAGLATFSGKLAAPRISVANLDFLPSRRHPRVLCLKLATEPAKAVEPIIVEARWLADRLGATSETRPWRAHLTLARFKGSRATLAVDLPHPPRAVTLPDSFCLMESFLSPQGPSYEIVERYSFRTGAST